MKYVIIGNGVAGTSAAEIIRNNEPNSLITIISDEQYPFYSRIRLIDFLAGTAEIDDLIMKSEDWYLENKIDLILNERIIKINSESKIATSSSGRTFNFDKLLLATGSNAFVPPIPGSDKKGVFTLRRIKDALAIRNHCQGSTMRVVVIGGGVLGLEAGNALLRSNHDITVIEAFPRLLPRQMDIKGSEILKQQMESMGFKFRNGLMTSEIFGTDSVEGVKLSDGEEIPCDMIIISAGIRPDLDLAKQLGLEIDKGIVVDDQLKVKAPDIFCAGDSITHRGRSYGIWPASEKQGKIAGINMTNGSEKYEGTIMSNILKVAGIDLVSIGDIDVNGNYETIVKKDLEKFMYKKLVLNENMIIGAIFYGDKQGWLKVKNAIESGKDIQHLKTQLGNWEFGGL